jgi:hypothetical protein
VDLTSAFSSTFNHDNFGVPAVGGSFDFFSKYSINGQLGRSGNVKSVTLLVSYLPCSWFIYMYCYRDFSIFMVSMAI